MLKIAVIFVPRNHRYTRQMWKTTTDFKYIPNCKDFISIVTAQLYIQLLQSQDAFKNDTGEIYLKCSQSCIRNADRRTCQRGEDSGFEEK